MAGQRERGNTSIKFKPHEKKKFKSTNSSFAQKEVTYEDTPLFFPPGYEKIFLLIYFVSLPYITGLLFLFLYVAKSQYKVFLSLNQEASFIMTWAIGYEILAALTLMYIIKMAISFSAKSRSGSKKKFRRPT